MKELVIDASAVLKWYLPDELFEDEALMILHRYVEGEIDLFAPSLLPYEILNALLVAERLGRVENRVTRESFQAFLDLQINLVDPLVGHQGVLSLAGSFQTSVYDASYLYLAKNRGIELLTGDKRLFNSVRGKLKWVLWVGQLGKAGAAD
ncbi:MAG: type II toxin-antitoxin system VapC family toxin [Pseudomonadota bacterium]